jgi:hypothetical protein
MKRYRLVVITLGGVTGYHAPAAHTHAHPNAGELLSQLEDGGTVIDARAALDADIGLAVRAPYVDPFLPPATICNSHGLSRPALAAVARGFWGGNSARMLETSPEEPFKGFDTVSLDLYTAFWRRTGARVGRMADGAVAWEDAPRAETAPTGTQ